MTKDKGPQGPSTSNPRAEVRDLKTGATITGVARLVFITDDGAKTTEAEVGRFLRYGDDGWTDFVPAPGVNEVERSLLEAVHAGVWGVDRPLRLHGDVDGVQDLDALDFADAFPEDAFDDLA